MECRNLEINLISATKLKDVGILFRTKVYATIKFEGVEHRTPTDKKGMTNPRWESLTKFFISESKTKEATITIKLYSHRKRWPKDRYIGMVEVSLKELLKKWAGRTLSYPMKGRDPSSVGQLNFSCRIVDTAATADVCIPSSACALGLIILRATLGLIFPGSISWS